MKNEIAKGFTFTHKHFIDADNKPIDCVVTAIRKGMVYYHCGGTKFKRTVENFTLDYGKN